MRVVLNNLTAIRQKTGIGHYVTELLRCLRAQYEGHQFTTFPGAWVEAGAGTLGAINTSLKRLKRRCFGGGNPHGSRRSSRNWFNNVARGWAAWHFDTFWSGRAFDLYHEPNYIPLPCDRPTIATIHDLSAVLHPHWHPPDRAAYYERHFEAGLKRCVLLLADSEFTRRELIENFNVAPNTVTSVALGIRADLRPMAGDAVRPVLDRLALPPQFILHVGTIEPRKNLLMLMQAYGDLPNSTRAQCPLILVGGWGWNMAASAEYYHDVARHRNVRHLGYVPDTDLPALYNGARALMFPSHYEGFGLPPLEMMACGGAVLASTAGALVETVGRQAHMIDAHDLSGWRDAMQRIIGDDDWLARLRHGAEEVARPYTWERCASETFRVYNTVVESQLSAPSASARCAA